uniref:SFRICE_007110 n=1 Tax=Spodoptera frugiperda TaxID=7108 RepID=A0A2H1W8U3_SPOFR
MATVEGRPAQYGVTLRQLRELMESRGAEGLAKINALGGPQEICKKLYTSPTDGPYQFFIYSILYHFRPTGTVSLTFL